VVKNIKKETFDFKRTKHNFCSKKCSGKYNTITNTIKTLYGIVHFKPIYDQTKLNKIQNKDTEKLKIAANKNINLIVIPDLVSSDKILKQAFDDVKDIINKLL